MPEFYRGKRVSVYRKRQMTFFDGTLTVSGPLVIEVAPGPDDRVKFIKNIRGLVTIWPQDTSPWNNYNAGFIALIRWPRAETFVSSEIILESSAVLHPVPYAMGGASLTIAWEFKGITLSQEERLYFCVKPAVQLGTSGALVDMLYAERDVLTP